MFAAWLFFEDRFKDVYFPDQEKWNRQIALSQFETGWDFDVNFPMRLLDGHLYMTLPNTFHWGDGKSSREKEIATNKYFKVVGVNGRSVSIIIKDIQREHLRFVKYRLPSHNLTIGRERTDICDREDVMSGMHGYLSHRGPGAVEFTDQSANGTFLNGQKINRTTVRLQFGDLLTFPTGLKLVLLGDCIALNREGLITCSRLDKYRARIAPEPIEGIAELPSVYVQYHRAPRMLKKQDDTAVEIEPPIAKQNTALPPLWQQVGPSFTMVLPMLMGTMLAGNRSGGMLSSGIVMISTSSALAVMWGLINRRYRKKQSMLTEMQRISLYQKYIQETEEMLHALNDKEYQRLIDAYPNVGQCALIPSDTTRKLWDRMPTHADFLRVRLGTGNVALPNPITTQKQRLSIIDDPLRDEPERLRRVYSTIADAPVTVNLRNEAVVGILGGSEAVMFSQGLLMQIASLHSYHDVRIAVLTEESSASQWSWTRWLPHVFANEDREMRMVASNPSAIHDVMHHLDEVLMMRKSNQDAAMETDDDQENATPLPHYIIFCTNSKLLEGEPILRRLLTNKLGMTLVIVAPSLELLPKESHLIINLDAKPGFLHTSEGDITQVDFEYASRNLLVSFAQQLAPLRVKDAAENAAIPTLVSFLDIYGVRRVEDIDIWRMWTENHTHHGLRSIIGYSAGSRPFILDISEKYHGPHGLIAGTTGSGKSVMLQTYILSLAINYSPEEIQFILIDYKGGGMANAFLGLPHVAGIIDNLQGERVIDRALASLNGEIHRRETLFKAMDVENITDYSERFGSDPNAVKLPHLIIIADEFAELKSEQPEFMKELVSASRVGRSLGVHLILATQKPAGSVSDEIWANSRFHLCLRVQTVADSRDMLKRPDAAYIKGTGRCFIQIGNDESFDQVQTSYSGLTYDPNQPRPEEMPRLLGDIGRPVSMPKRVKANGPAGKKPKTQMDAVLERISQVAAEHGMSHSRQMWLPEMPSRIYFNNLAIFNDNRMRDGVYANAPEGVQFLLGLADDTDEQRYIPYVANLTQMRNLMIVGLAGTGKTTAVQSIVYSLANQYDPEHLHMYILSLTSQTLGTLGKFPHVGDIAFENDTVEIKRFINMLYQEEERRSELFAQAATDSFIEYNRSQVMNGQAPEPAIVVIVDRYEQLKAMFENDEATTARIFSLIREGSGRGIHFIVTALAKNEVPFKLHSFFNGIALQLSERADYSEVIGKRVPIEMPPIAGHPGRGMALVDGRPFEIQLALAGHEPKAPATKDFALFANWEKYIIEERLPDADTMPDSDRAKQVTAFSEMQAALWKGRLPARIPRIPAEPTWEQFITEPHFEEMQKSPYTLPVGYDMSKGELASLDLEDNYSMFVTGPKGSGKTNYLKFLARLFADRGAQVHIIADTEWTQLAREIGAQLYTTTDEIIAYTHSFQESVLRDSRKPKKMAALAQGKAALRKQALEFEPYVIIIDNAQRFNTDFNALELGVEMKFLHTIYSQLVSRADHYNLFLFLAAPFAAQNYFMQEPLRSLISQARGFSFGGKVSDCNPLGIAGMMPIARQRVALPTGHAYMVAEGKLTQIVTPLAEKPEDE